MDWNRPNNLSLVCLYLSFKIYISFFIIWTFFFHLCRNNKKEIYNDKYKHTRDRLFGIGLELTIFSVVRGNHANQYCSNANGSNPVRQYGHTDVHEMEPSTRHSCMRKVP